MGPPIQFSPTWHADVLTVGHSADVKASFGHALGQCSPHLPIPGVPVASSRKRLDRGCRVLVMGDEPSAWALLRSPSRRLVSEHLQHPSGVQPGFLPVPGQSDTATGPRVGVDHIVPAGKVCAVNISVLSLAVMWVIPASLTFFSQCMLI